MSGVNGVSTNSAAGLVQILDNQMKSQTDMAQKMIKMVAEEKVQATKNSTLGAIIDLYA